MIQTSYVDGNHHFPTYSAQNPAKIPCFYDFLVKNWFLLLYNFNASKFPRGCWLYDVTVTSYEVQWYTFWYQWKEGVHTYTLVANIGVSGVLYRKSREGVTTTPFGGRVTKKKISGGRGLNTIITTTYLTAHVNETLNMNWLCFDSKVTLNVTQHEAQ